MRTVNLNTEIPPSRELHITLPADVPTGPAEIVLLVSSPSDAEASTLGELANSEFFGMWKDRPDVIDNLHFSEDLRSEGWKRFA